MNGRCQAPAVANPARNRLWAIPAALAFCAAYIVSASTPLLYHSNQNTKFLQGLADAWPDRLGWDWTAQTTDGLPAFAAIVSGIARFADPVWFYVLQGVLLCIMCLSMLALAAMAAGKHSREPVLLFCAAAGLVYLTGDVQQDSLRGIAGQYMSKGYFQPSEFGIIYLPALLLAAMGNRAAPVLAAVPALVHPAYISISAVICLCLLLYEARHNGRPVLTRIAVIVALIVVTPVYLAFRFAPTDPDTFARANDILAFERIPHHSDPEIWAGFVALRKLVIVLLASAVCPRGPVKWAFVGLLAYALAGTLFVWLTKNAEVSLIAPWRASIVLVPLSVSILLGWLFACCLDLAEHRAARGALVAGVSILGATAVWDGAWIKVARMQEAANPPDYITHIRATAAKGDVYLIPPGLEEFRLHAMVPVYVTWKTHPYLDTEVLEWRARVERALDVYATPDEEAGFNCVALMAAVEADPTITHFALPTVYRAGDDPAFCPVLALAFDGEAMMLYTIEPQL